VNIVVELARIASEPADVRARGHQVLELLRSLVSFEAASIHLVDSRRRELMSLASIGFDARTSEHMNGPAFAREVEAAGMNHERPALCFPACPRAHFSTWTEYLEPAGLHGGIWTGLFYPGGRRLGLLTMHTRRWDQLTSATCEFLGAVAPAVSNAVDPMRSVVTVAQMVGGAMAGIVMTRPDDVVPLAGLPSHHLVEPDSPVLLAVQRQLSEGQTYISFLCPVSGFGGLGEHLRITALACAPEPFLEPVAVVVVSAAGGVYGLTGRELEILGFLVEGWPNNRIAGTLFITERTVAAHVEHILAKLGVANRTLAAVRALRAGLYVPCDLATVRLNGHLRPAGRATV